MSSIFAYSSSLSVYGVDLASSCPSTASSVTMLEEGCYVNGERDCTAMCTNANLIWGDSKDVNMNATANMRNCINYLIVSNAMEANSNVSIFDWDILELYGIRNDSQVELTSINSAVESCMHEYCAEEGRCSSNQWRTREYDGFNVTYPRYGAICGSVKVSINPDIAGIGMLSAYLIAAVLLLLIYVALRTSKNLLRYFSTPYFYLRTRKWQTTKSSAKELQMSASSSHHVAILVSSLTEFQKGQCIFWLAIDAAVVVALGGSAQTLSARSLAGLQGNLAALKTICLSALVFVNFGLYCLHAAQKRSWYIFALSLTTSIFSVVAYVMTLIAKEDNLAPDPDFLPVPGCGRINPTTYCNLYDIDSNEYDFLAWLRSRELYLTMFIFSGIVNVALLVDIIMHNTEFAKRTPFLNMLRASGNETSRWRSASASSGRCLIELLFLVFLGFLFTDLLMIYFTGGGKLGGMNTWGFGQIIALTIWIPVVLEWMYATTRGLENASDHRIVTPYKLIRTDTKSSGRIGWDYNKITSTNYNSTDGIATQLNDLSRRRTDIEHRISIDQGLPATSASENADYAGDEHNEPLIPRKPVPAPIIAHVPEQDITHTSGSDFTPASRTDSMLMRGERKQERSMI